MLDEVKLALNQKIDNNLLKYNEKIKLDNDISNKLSDISNLEFMEKKLYKDKLYFYSSIVFSLVSLSLIPILKLDIILSICGIFGLSKSLKYKKDITYDEGEYKFQKIKCSTLGKRILLENGYSKDMFISDSVDITDEQLLETKEILINQKNSLLNDINYIIDEMNYNKKMLGIINRYLHDQEFLNSHINEFKKNNLNIKDGYLDDYLNEKINYSKIHFNNNIENNKKLIKKI